jgi:hypothetical protein
MGFDRAFCCGLRTVATHRLTSQSRPVYLNKRTTGDAFLKCAACHGLQNRRGLRVCARLVPALVVDDVSRNSVSIRNRRRRALGCRVRALPSCCETLAHHASCLDLMPSPSAHRSTLIQTWGRPDNDSRIAFRAIVLQLPSLNEVIHDLGDVGRIDHPSTRCS